jgi:hypothetical protein
VLGNDSLSAGPAYGVFGGKAEDAQNNHEGDE